MVAPGTKETFRQMSQDGADISSPAALPTGGWGIRGWLSAIYTRMFAAIESNNAFAVNVQDQHTRTGDVYFSQTIGSLFTLDIDAVVDEYSFTATTGHGILVGEQLVIYDSVGDRLYVGQALTVSVDVIGVDTPINFNYTAASTFGARSTKDINVNGAVTRQTFAVSPPIAVELDITRIMFEMQTTNFPELDMFGDIAAGLTRGLVLRVVNGINVNYFNVKQNGDFALLMYDVKEYAAAKHGVNGLSGRLTYAGQAKHGVTIRLEKDDRLEVIIQDDLSSLLKFRMLAAFHEVAD